MDLDRDRCRSRTRDGAACYPTISTVEVTDGHAFGPIRTARCYSVIEFRSPADAPRQCFPVSIGKTNWQAPLLGAVSLARFTANSGPRSLALPRVLIRSSSSRAPAMLTHHFVLRSPLLASRRTPGLARWRSLTPLSETASFAVLLRDDFLRNVRRNLRIAIEDHRVRRPTLGPRPEVADVAEHLRQRHECRHDAGAAALGHGLDLSTTRVQVADDVTHVVFGRDDLDAHQRLQKHRLGHPGGFLHRDGTRDLERHFGRVDLVVGTVDQGQLDAQQ